MTNIFDNVINKPFPHSKQGQLSRMLRSVSVERPHVSFVQFLCPLYGTKPNSLLSTAFGTIFRHRSWDAM